MGHKPPLSASAYRALFRAAVRAADFTLPSHDETLQRQEERKALSGVGSRFITVIESGHYWCDDADVPLSDGWWFWQQVQQCQYIVPPGKAFDTHLQWSVPASAKVSTPAGPQAVHDDRLVSAVWKPSVVLLAGSIERLVSATKRFRNALPSTMRREACPRCSR